MLYLRQFAYMPDSDSSLDQLAELAQKENWEYRYCPTEQHKPILYSYLNHTCFRLHEEDKVLFSPNNERACFNTGLVTENEEEIFALFEPNPDNPKWKLMGFFKESDRNLLPFNPLPSVANYFDDPRDLLYDVRLEMRINYDHIVEDNKERFPAPYNTQTSYQLRNYLDAVVKQAIKRVKRNYKTAIPQYYQGHIQLLLPLCFEDPTRADLALVVDRHGDVYRANTCLELDVAYKNARLLAKLDTGWLQP